MKSTFLVFLLVALILETTFTTVPLLLVLLNLNTVTYKKPEIFGIAFLVGVLLDILSFKNVGASAFLFVLFLFFVFLYKRKFEIETSLFVAISTFLGSFIYLYFVFLRFMLPEAILASILAILIFKIMGKLNG